MRVAKQCLVFAALVAGAGLTCQAAESPDVKQEGAVSAGRAPRATAGPTTPIRVRNLSSCDIGSRWEIEVFNETVGGGPYVNEIGYQLSKGDTYSSAGVFQLFVGNKYRVRVSGRCADDPTKLVTTSEAFTATSNHPPIELTSSGPSGGSSTPSGMIHQRNTVAFDLSNPALGLVTEARKFTVDVGDTVEIKYAFPPASPPTAVKLRLRGTILKLLTFNTSTMTDASGNKVLVAIIAVEHAGDERIVLSVDGNTKEWEVESYTKAF